MRGLEINYGDIYIYKHINGHRDFMTDPAQSMKTVAKFLKTLHRSKKKVSKEGRTF